VNSFFYAPFSRVMRFFATDEKLAMNNGASQLHFIQEALASDPRWSEPVEIDARNGSVAKQLFAELAFEAAARDLSKCQSPVLSKDSVKVGEEDPEIANKVTKFVKERLYYFQHACESGLLFSMLERSACKEALRNYLTSCRVPIVALLMTQNKSVWLTEEELNTSFGGAFGHLCIGEIGKACSELTRAYEENSDHKAGYYLLWLIKQSTGSNFSIPPKETFNGSSVKEVLSQFITSDSGKVALPSNFIETFLFRSYRGATPLCTIFLEANAYSRFINFIIDQLQSIPMDAWPEKGRIITDLLEIVSSSSQSKIIIARGLSSSVDTQTAQIGLVILNALQATSLTSAIPHFYALIELLPNFDHTSIRYIFNKIFTPFLGNRQIDKNDPEFTRRLTFNQNETVFAKREVSVFVQGNLMAGVYDYRGENGTFPYLLAYNMNTEKMEWGIPLIQSPSENGPLDISTVAHPVAYHLNRVGDYITLLFIGEQKVRFIDINTGDTRSMLELPYVNKNQWDRLHITPNGFCYQTVGTTSCRKLIGGKICDSKMIPSFEAEIPRGPFHHLSTHVGFFDNYKGRLVVYSQTGDRVEIVGCLSAYAQGDKLYLVEQDPSQENRCLLTVRTMTNDENVISPIEKSIPLRTKKARLKRLCDNGQLILFNVPEHSDESPIFVDLRNDEVVYCGHKLCANGRRVVNTVSGELWSWDQSSKEIWKISSKAAVLMGSLDSGRGTQFLHVDQSDHLYFVDISF